MEFFQYQDNKLHCEDVSLTAVATQVGTPVYVYSQAELIKRAEAYMTAVPPNTLICYATKANGNPTLIRLLAEMGLGGDVTSGGELFLALRAGIAPEKIIYSGVGKTRAEIEMALDAGIRALHVESEMEMDTIAEITAERQTVARIGLRVNPNIDAQTHPYISTGLHGHKFGVNPERAMALMQEAAAHPWLEPIGIAAHIGSQITKLSPYKESAQFLIGMADELASMGIKLDYLDVGGGLGIDYNNQQKTDNSQQATPEIGDWVATVSESITQAEYNLVLEPGRSIVGPMGALVIQIVYTKEQGGKQFVIADAGMNDLLRPSLYKARHPILPVQQPATSNQQLVDIVGPICETSDTLAKERPFPPTEPGDLLAIMQAGAYGFAMASNYNGRLRPAEVLVNGAEFQIIRQRQTYAHLLDGCSE
ncbi:MAG: diaminopimelate decarboxylase [Chloroflexi bacterium]|nr:diaminopimelate decarboxylase [Chloroflexota bacterium]